MTFNELTAIFAKDDLNPNAKLVFYIDTSGHTDEQIIDDVSATKPTISTPASGRNEYISIYLKGR